MFTGIVTDIGRVVAVEAGGDGDNADRRIEIATKLDLSDAAIGASIACAGVCLTVIEKTADSFAVQASGETLDRTTAGHWGKGTRINLERALRLGDELGGHIVSGHVDGLAVVSKVEPVAGSLKITFTAPEALSKFIAAKGSVTVDGVSLTVNEVAGNDFTVNLIPHTQKETTLGGLGPGAFVNLEIDMLARYVARLAERSA